VSGSAALLAESLWLSEQLPEKPKAPPLNSDTPRRLIVTVYQNQE
jgi:hypothetical protein